MLNAPTQSIDLEAEHQGTKKRLTFSVSTELMETYLAGMPIDAQQKVAAAFDSEGHPLIFSVGTEGFLHCLMRTQGSTGWKQIDLSHSLLRAFPALGTRPVVKTFALSQDRRGTLRFALAVELKRNGQKVNKVFLSRDLPNDPNEAFRNGLAGKWLDRSPEEVLDVTAIKLGTADHMAEPVSMLVVANRGGEAFLFTVDTDPNRQSQAWKEFPLPENADPNGILDIAPGSYLKRGVWTLYTVAGRPALVFTSFDDGRGKPVSIDYPDVPSNASALGVLSGANPKFSDLFVAGKGIYMFPGRVTDRFKTLGEGESGSVFQSLAISEDRGLAQLWAQNDRGDLVLIAKSGSTWSRPMTPLSGIAQLAPFTNWDRGVHELFAVTDQNRFLHLWQDRASGLWRHGEVVLPDTDRHVSFKCYATCIHVADQNGLPVVGFGLRVNAQSASQVIVNGRSQVIDTHQAIEARSDLRGQITLLARVAELEAPVFHLTSDALAGGFDLHPGALVHEALAQKTEREWRSATYVHGPRRGQKVLRGIGDDHLSAAHRALGELLKLNQDAASRGAASGQLIRPRPQGSKSTNRISTRNLSRGYAWGITVDQKGARFHEGGNARTFVDELLPVAFPGAWFVVHTIEHFRDELRQKPKGFFLHMDGDGVLQLIVDLGKAVLQTTVEFVEQMGKTVAWLLKELLDIDLDDLVAWLGFLFDWRDILQTHRVLKRMADRGFEKAGAEFVRIKHQVDGFFDNLETAIVHVRPLPSHVGDVRVTELQNRFSSQVSGLFETADKFSRMMVLNPVGNWSLYQLFSSNLLSSGGETDKLTRLFDRFAPLKSNLLEDELGNFGTTFSQLFGDLSLENLTPNQFLAQIGGDLAESLLRAIRILFDDFLEALPGLLDAVRELCKEDIQVPLIGSLLKDIYRDIAPGSKFSSMDVVLLLAAIPITVGYKSLTGRVPFPDGFKLPEDLSPRKRMHGRKRDDQAFPAARNGVRSTEEGEHGHGLEFAALGLQIVGGVVHAVMDTLVFWEFGRKGEEEPLMGEKVNGKLFIVKLVRIISKFMVGVGVIWEGLNQKPADGFKLTNGVLHFFEFLVKLFVESIPKVDNILSGSVNAGFAVVIAVLEGIDYFRDFEEKSRDPAENWAIAAHLSSTIGEGCETAIAFGARNVYVAGAALGFEVVSNVLDLISFGVHVSGSGQSEHHEG